MCLIFETLRFEWENLILSQNTLQNVVLNQLSKPIYKYFCPLDSHYLLALQSSSRQIYNVGTSEHYNRLDLHRTWLSEREVRPFRVADYRRLFSPKSVIFEMSTPLKLRIVACNFSMGSYVADIDLIISNYSYLSYHIMHSILNNYECNVFRYFIIIMLFFCQKNR